MHKGRRSSDTHFVVRVNKHKTRKSRRSPILLILPNSLSSWYDFYLKHVRILYRSNSNESEGILISSNKKIPYSSIPTANASSLVHCLLRKLKFDDINPTMLRKAGQQRLMDYNDSSTF